MDFMKIEDTPEKLLYSRASAAAALDLSPRAIDYAIRTGSLEAVRFGKRVLIPYRSLLAFALRGATTIRPEVPERSPRRGDA